MSIFKIPIKNFKKVYNNNKEFYEGFFKKQSNSHISKNSLKLDIAIQTLNLYKNFFVDLFNSIRDKKQAYVIPISKDRIAISGYFNRGIGGFVYLADTETNESLTGIFDSMIYDGKNVIADGTKVFDLDGNLLFDGEGDFSYVFHTHYMGKYIVCEKNNSLEKTVFNTDIENLNISTYFVDKDTLEIVSELHFKKPYIRDIFWDLNNPVWCFKNSDSKFDRSYYRNVIENREATGEEVEDIWERLNQMKTMNKDNEDYKILEKTFLFQIPIENII